jgi:hypothetical protein
VNKWRNWLIFISTFEYGVVLLKKNNIFDIWSQCLLTNWTETMDILHWRLLFIFMVVEKMSKTVYRSSVSSVLLSSPVGYAQEYLSHNSNILYSVKWKKMFFIHYIRFSWVFFLSNLVTKLFILSLLIDRKETEWIRFNKFRWKKNILLIFAFQSRSLGVFQWENMTLESQIFVLSNYSQSSSCHQKNDVHKDSRVHFRRIWNIYYHHQSVYEYDSFIFKDVVVIKNLLIRCTIMTMWFSFQN